MKKSLIALAAVGAFSGVAMAESSLTIYGIIDLGLVKQNRGDIDNNPAFLALPAAAQTALQDTVKSLGGTGFTNKELNVAQATKSRIGFKGVEDLGGGLSAKFELEHRFLPDTGATNPAGGNLFWDKSIVGLTSQSIGEITLGRDYGPTFYAQYLQDPWINQGIAEVGGTTYAFAGYNLGAHEVRYNNALFYKAQVGGITALASVELSEKSGKKNRYGIGAMYNAGPLFVVGAYDQAPSPVRPAETDNLAIIGIAYDFGVIKPRLSYARSTVQTPFGGEVNPTSVILAATIPLGTNLIKLGYAHLDWDTGEPFKQATYAGLAQLDPANATSYGTLGTIAAGGTTFKQDKLSVGYEHVLSKRTALYTDVTHGRTKNYDSVTGIDFGLRHAF